MVKISSCLIIKNEMPHISELIDQLCQFSSEVIIVDTGSTDGFRDPDQINKLPAKVKVYDYEWQQDFASARNYSFSLAAEDSDFIFWCDGDDVIDPVLLTRLEHSSIYDNPEDLPDLISIPYKYWIDRSQTFLKVRLVRKSLNIKWVGRIHEAMIYDNTNTNTYYGDDAIIIHAHRKNSGARNLSIFQAMDSDNQITGVRELYYYGMELYSNKMYTVAYFMLSTCADYHYGWYIDRINAVRGCMILENLVSIKPKSILELALSVYNDGGRRADLCRILGDEYLKLGNWGEAARHYSEAVDLGIPIQEDDFLYDYVSHGSGSALQASLCWYRAGNTSNAIEYNNRALEMDPTNSNALYNKQFYDGLQI